MNHRYAFLTAAFAVATMMGCAAPVDADVDDSEDEIGVTASALKKHKDCDDDDDDGHGNGNGHGNGTKTVKADLKSFDGTTLTMVGPAGRTLSANITLATNFRTANLSQFIPQDPIRPLLVNYNDSLQSGRRSQILIAVQQLASAGVSARVVLNGTNAIRSFRPVR